MRFIVKNSDIFPMPGAPTYIHLATIGYGLQEFVAFTSMHPTTRGKTYIEEVVLAADRKTEDVIANLKFIDDDNLANEIVEFLNSKKLLDVGERMNQAMDQGTIRWIM